MEYRNKIHIELIIIWYVCICSNDARVEETRVVEIGGGDNYMLSPSPSATYRPNTVDWRGTVTPNFNQEGYATSY